MLVIALPYHANIAAAVAQARAGQLRKINLDRMTVDELQTLQLVGAAEVTGCDHALDLLRPRNQIIFCNGAEP